MPEICETSVIGAALSIGAKRTAPGLGEKDRALSSMARMLWSMRSASFASTIRYA